MTEKWPTASLGELCGIVSGGTPARADRLNFGGSIPWVKISDLLQGTITSTDETISEKGLASSSAKILPVGTVLLSVFATIGRTARLAVDAATNQAIVGITPMRPEQLDSRYLRRFLDQSAERLGGQSRGVAQANINLTILKALEVPLPSIEEQRRITAVLDQADELRRKRQGSLAMLGSFMETMFLDIVADTSASGVLLGEIGEVQGGLQVTHARAGNPIEVPYLRVANVHRGRLDLDQIKGMRVTATELERTRLCPDDLLVVEGHGNAGEIGRVARWTGQLDPCVHQNHLIRVRVNSDLANAAFLEAFLNSTIGRQSLLRAARTTSGLNTISVKDVKAVRVVLPPLEAQTQFADCVAGIERVASAQRKHLAEIASVFVSLQSRAFAGQL